MSTSNKRRRKVSKVEKPPTSYERSYPISGPCKSGSACSKNLVLFKSTGWLFESYSVVFGTIQKVIMFRNFRKIKPSLDCNKRLGKTLENLISTVALIPIFMLSKIALFRYASRLL